MLRSAGARRLRKTLKRCPAGAKIAQRIASWTWELELIQTQMAQKPMLRAEVGMRVRCANKASAE